MIESNYHLWIFSPPHWPPLLTFLLLKRGDLNPWSYLSNRLFTIVPNCPHRYCANTLTFLLWNSSDNCWSGGIRTHCVSMYWIYSPAPIHLLSSTPEYSETFIDQCVYQFHHTITSNETRTRNILMLYSVFNNLLLVSFIFFF